MNITIYIRREIEDRFRAEKDKSKLINRLLEKYYANEHTIPVNPYKKPVVEKVQKFEELKEQLDVRCKGNHHMSRKDCGKPGCPWS